MRVRTQQHERGLFVVCSFAAVMSGTITLPAARHISSCVFVSTILFETKIIDGSHVQREEGTVLLKKQNQTEAQTDEAVVLDDDDVDVDLGDDVLEEDGEDNVPLEDIADVTTDDDDG